MDQKKIGVIAIFIASFMWAIEPIFVKLSYQHAHVFEIAAIRASIILIIALIYLGFQKTNPLKIQRQQITALFYIAIAGTIIADFLYYYALMYASVLNAVLLGHLQPIFIILIGYFLLRSERLTKLDYWGIFFMMLSAVLVSTRTLENASNFQFLNPADALVLIATVAWASAAIAVRKYLTMLSAGVITFYRFFFACIFFTGYFLVTQSLHIHIYQIIVGIIVGVGTICYYESLKRLKAAQVSGLELSSPLLAALLGFIILQESITIMQIVGMILLILGVYFLSMKQKNKRQRKKVAKSIKEISR